MDGLSYFTFDHNRKGMQENKLVELPPSGSVPIYHNVVSASKQHIGEPCDNALSTYTQCQDVAYNVGTKFDKLYLLCFGI